MKTLIAFVSAVAMMLCQNSFCAAADEGGSTLYRCKNEAGKFTFQGKPCPDNATTLSSWKDDTPKKPPALPKIQQPPPQQAPQPTPTSFSMRLTNGAYLTQGSANSVPLVFHVDTGATYVSIPQEIADKAGMKCMKQSRSDTANGMITVCESVINKMTFGVFSIQNVTAMIMPNLKQPLLGMNVLAGFHVEQSDGLMKITNTH
jgi:clan AA aspartic protease (TIGR02281 family)